MHLQVAVDSPVTGDPDDELSAASVGDGHKNIENYTEVDISPAYRYLRRSSDWMGMAMRDWDPVEMISRIEDIAAPICEDALNSSEMISFIKSAPKFDLYIMERLLGPCFYGVVHAVGSPPVVGLATHGAHPCTHWSHRNPDSPAYLPLWVLPYSHHMSFWERLYSAYIWLYFNFVWHSMDVQEWLDGATEGAIYFSLGTNVLSSTMPPEKRRAFLDAFSQLPQSVLWKWEKDDATDLPPNVRMSKWLPQQSVLAHPNVRIFITQGGLQSFNEATYYGVPLIGIPFMGDQHYNVAKMVSAEIGYKLQFRSITKDVVLKATRAILGDPKYRENMKK
ncbi:UDP-glucuronosyltransferase 2B31-like [Schistocerca americana]|uniref:UDP-glucuronosyltransferase 2B31-like n=1 Tax=Schistocerca americana TaxID=7009 RepID=UPI001F4F597E|nr:UDP-glucuronosyltransferase 2B31-like [Schistocerca americana]